MSGPILPGARVRKVWGEPGDLHALGAEGEVRLAIGPLPKGTIVQGEDCAGEFGYMVVWDDFSIPVFVRGKKLEEIKA